MIGLRMRKNSSLIIIQVMLLTLIISGPVFVYSFFNKSSNTIKQDYGNVLGRSYPLAQADIHAGEGGTITVEGVTAIISPGTFASDVYMRVDEFSRATPISVSGLWQIGNMYNVRLRFMSDDNEATQYHANKKYILSFPYTQQYLTTEQDVNFDENYLKLVRGQTQTGPWEVLENTVVDVANKKASVITDRGGYYTVTGGFYSPAAPTVKLSEQATESQNVVVLKENEIVITITPEISIAPTIKSDLGQKKNLKNSRQNIKPVTEYRNKNTNFLAGILEAISSFFQ